MANPVVEEDILCLKEECTLLEPLLYQLKEASSLQGKLELLNHSARVKKFPSSSNNLHSFLETATLQDQFIVKSLIVIGQAKRIFGSFLEDSELPKLQALLQQLYLVDTFYREIGGIVGYHFLILKCLLNEDEPRVHEIKYFAPEGVDISLETKQVMQLVAWGIEKMEEMAEIYPVGGAADRLNLQDEKTGIPLPAAKLKFHGKTLLERMIADLQAREHLHYKLFGKQICTPIVMMTSQEKDNHAQILSICEEKNWFGRPKDSFRFFSQPAVPSVNKSGEWCLQGPLQLLLKPGGHGVIWKLARDSQTFEWLFSKKRKKALIRQINNPMAGIDYGLLAFTGYGCQRNKVFGFASCTRKAGAAEGVNVLLEKKKPEGFEYVLTNVEYCDLQKFQLVERLKNSKFSSNTNILFVDLLEVNRAIDACPFPGVLINPKKTVYRKGETLIEEEVARLESTMQNIADCFSESFASPLSKGNRKDKLKTFLTFNQRNKTISSVKREYIPGGALDETPEGCFLDFMKNAQELLLDYCGMTFVKKKAYASFPFLFFYHPCLGPLYSIISQKIRYGKISSGSELNVDISEIEIENLNLDGSLSIQALCPMGDEKDGALNYSEKKGKCRLINVSVKNQGIDWEHAQTFWKKETHYQERCHILIHGDGEFFAEDVNFQGSVFVEVESGIRVTAREENGKIQYIRESITAPSWGWNYKLSKDFQISLKLIENF
jgi:UDP-N-acetylglucosamine pyrophosphorylase